MPPDIKPQGVLLYYKYVDIGRRQQAASSEGDAADSGPGCHAAAIAPAEPAPDMDARLPLKQFYEASCGALGLRGRVRVAWDGVNVTVGGDMDALRRHVQDVKDHPLLRGCDVDFKLAEYVRPHSTGTAHETKFDGLTVNVCKELVTLGPQVREAALGCASCLDDPPHVASVNTSLAHGSSLH